MVGNWVTWVLSTYRAKTGGGADSKVPLERWQDITKKNLKNLRQKAELGGGRGIISVQETCPCKLTMQEGSRRVHRCWSLGRA